MASFRYKVRDKVGKLIQGTMEARDNTSLVEYFKNMGYTPISIIERKAILDIVALWKNMMGISQKDLNVFTRQLATFEGAGMPILSGLKALEEQTENRHLKEVTGKVKRDVEGGSDLSDAMSRHPRIFSKLYVHMIQAGEAAGKLKDILDRLAELGEHDEETRSQIKSATRYPIMVVAVITFVFFGVTTFVLPKFATLFARFGSNLPLPTRILLGLNAVLRHYALFFIIGIAALISAFIWFINTPMGRRIFDNFQLKVPVFGIMINKISISRFSRILGTLIQSGIPMLQALDITSQIVGNVVIEKAINEVREHVKEGRGLAGPMRLNKIFPPMLVHMVSTGEESGAIDTLLLKVSEHYDLEVGYAIKNLTTMIEPILILALGSIVLVLALAVFLPMWNMASVFKA
ncbi:MAG: type II secretion system F family protein [Candidatus Omnitrophota bacterium]